ncbi:Zn-ribbon protein, possibly nucleic acid-binding protein [Halobacteroides halobius DSM 5150]|uniref:Zn-ribbon protein, possibly nucleic acid-binding protein n=1 Tax=Halobacteroides halobius (strain ATCC 35273 / DSM 5150 / MD-1) TaxID=748449 RepID=L0KCJ6_HALHC|nr:C4-type zinc ribbon domain-containing protein [Halobacteroides halobius]AGB41778.1 Zn-ribbon protein, possibly nucleic acid-binding protein [Halobacteroides halobius DSM 5150]
MEKLELLYKLQKIDDQIEKLQEKKDNKPVLNEADNLEQIISKLMKEKQNKKDELGDIQDKVKDIEFEEARLERKEKDYKKQLYSGENSSPKELEQLTDKLDLVTEEKEELEEDLLDLMMQEEAKEEEILGLKEKIAENESRLLKLQNEEESAKQELKEELIKFNQQRQELKEKLGDQLLIKYNHLKEKKAGKAVVALRDGYCMGCRMSLPIKLVKKVEGNAEVVTCNSCGRILYDK